MVPESAMWGPNHAPKFCAQVVRPNFAPKLCAQILRGPAQIVRPNFWGSRPNRAPKFWGVPPKSRAQIFGGPAQIVRPNYSCIFSTNGEPWGGMLDAPKICG